MSEAGKKGKNLGNSGKWVREAENWEGRIGLKGTWKREKNGVYRDTEIEQKRKGKKVIVMKGKECEVEKLKEKIRKENKEPSTRK